MSTDPNTVRARTEANFKKEERAKDGAKAMMEYIAQSRAIREKTERLRALRLAKEAAEKASEVAVKPPRSKSKAPKASQ